MLALLTVCLDLRRLCGGSLSLRLGLHMKKLLLLYIWRHVLHLLLEVHHIDRATHVGVLHSG